MRLEARTLKNLTIAILIGASLIAVVLPGRADVGSPARFRCRGSLLRIGPNAAGRIVEPRIANKPGVPCVARESSVLPATLVGPAAALAGESTTYVTKCCRAAFSSIAQAVVFLPPGIFTGQAATGAIVGCDKGAPFAEGFSDVSLVAVGPVVVFAPPNSAHLHRMIPGVGKLHVNHVTRAIGAGGGHVLARAIWLEAKEDTKERVGDVVVSESIAGYDGDPCA